MLSTPAVRLSSLLIVTALAACQCEPLDVVRVSLAGRACRPDTGQGIANGLAVLEGPVDKQALTGGDGRFRFDGLLPGVYTIAVTDAADASVVRTFDEVVVGVEPVTTMPQDSACREPELPPAGAVAGQVCNRHTGGLVADATVSLIVADGAVLETRTDTEGRFELDGAPVGEHVLAIVGLGYQRSFLVQIEAGATFRLDLGAGCDPVRASEGGIVGEFCDPSGANGGKLVGAEVTVTSNATGETTRDITDLEGWFEVNGLTPGFYKVEVVHPGATLLEPAVEVSAGTIQTLVGPQVCAGQTVVVGGLEGNVCDFQAGGRFTGLADLLQANAVRATVDVAEDGRFAFTQLAPGTYDVRLYYPAGDPNAAYSRTLSGVVVQALQTTYVQEDACPGAPEECRTFINNPEQTNDGRILLVVDKSGSMGELDDNNQVKWTVMKGALTQTTTTLQSTVEFGLLLYPRVGGSNCAPPARSDAVPLAFNNANAISAALNITPGGGTPTAQALAVARDLVSTYVGDGRPLAVVLATDGGPNCAVESTNTSPTCECSFDAQQGQCLISNCLDAQATYDAIGRISELGVKTYVVGVSGVETFSSFAEVLNRMARAGGTERPDPAEYYPAENAVQLEDALEAITRRVLACRVEVGEALTRADSVQVRVGFNDLPRDPSRRNGWDITAPGVLELFGSACDAAVGSLNSVFVRTCETP